jgi:hypothetical protein
MPEGQAPGVASAAVRSVRGAANPHAEIAHRVAFGVFVTTTVLACGLVFMGVRRPSVWAWIYGLHAVVAALTTLAALARRLPLQNVVACGLALLLTMGMALAMVASGLHDRAGLASGDAAAGPSLGLHPLGWQAWPAPFLWMAVLLASRQTAKVLLHPWRRQRPYGWWLLGTAAVLAWLAVLVSCPFVDQAMRWWSWPQGGVSWYGVPPEWLGGFLLLIAVFLLLAGAWLIPKRPTGRAADFEPVWVWSGLVLWFAAGNLRAGFLVAAGSGIAAVVAVAALAWRALQMPVSPASGPGGPA